MLAEHGYRDCASQRRRYKEDLALRAIGEKENSQEWDRIRRGWYLGSAQFRDRLLEKLESLPGRNKVKAGAVEVGSDHAQWQAERIAWAGLKFFRLSESELVKLPKSDQRKVLIARLLKAHTGVTLAWISARLRMGADSHVSRLSHSPMSKADRVSARQIMSKVKT